MRVPHPNVVPPNGYKFQDSSTGVLTQIEGTSLENLAEKVLKHRLANQRPPGDPLQEIIDGICSKFPTACREEQLSGAPPVTTNLTAGIASRVASWFAAFYQGARADRGVRPSESERRADVCATCPKNTPLTGCGSCVDAIHRLFFVWKRDRYIPREKELGGCTVLGQHNAAAVLASMLPPVPPAAQPKLPPNCWRKE